MIENERTQPLSTIRSPMWRDTRQTLPTMRQLRERCGMSYFEVAHAARVRPRIVYWMEQGIAVQHIEAVYILSVFSQRLGWVCTFENVRGIRVKEDEQKMRSERHREYVVGRR